MVLTSAPLLSLRAIRPSLFDARFVGDPWVVDHCDGTASVRLDDYLLTKCLVGVFDLPTMNRLWTELRSRCRAQRGGE